MYCQGIPHGNARVIRCLQANKDGKDFGQACLKEVKAYEQLASQDYRLNHRLRTACTADVAALCKGACQLSSEKAGTWASPHPAQPVAPWTRAGIAAFVRDASYPSIVFF